MPGSKRARYLVDGDVVSAKCTRASPTGTGEATVTSAPASVRAGASKSAKVKPESAVS